MSFDWHQFHLSNADAPPVVDPRRRLRICAVGFAAALVLIFCRVAQLEVTQGAGFRAEALRPIARETVLPAARGRILARDGAVLACDETIRAVAVEYRWLQDPPDERWLRNMVRMRLPKTNRKNADKFAAEKAKVTAERAELMRRLAELCGLSPAQWAARTQKIQARVQRISESINDGRLSEAAQPERADDSWTTRVRRLLLDDPPTPRKIAKEELQPHVVVEDVRPAVVSEIESNTARYPGVKVVELTRRKYPQGALAAHVLGHLGPRDEKNAVGQTFLSASVPADRQTGMSAPPENPRADRVGRMGVERQYEVMLQAQPGVAVEQTDRSGRTVTSYRRLEPTAGRDVELTLDVALQRTAEELLRSAEERGQNSFSPAEKRGQNSFSPENSSDPFFLGGGAVVAMDVYSGAILAAASAPAFDPNLFARGSSEQLDALMSDRSNPLFDRTSRMAIPPGSTFKALTAVALLESGTISPQTSLFCQGYLHQPDRQRCEIYVHQGVGHGEVTLLDALAQSCNVYFFHFAESMGPRPLADWAGRFGFGRPTGVDLPGEAAGIVPCPENIRDLEGHSWRTTDTQSMSVGQSSLTVTPLQMVRMMAAVANGGRLVTPHVAKVGSGFGGQGSGNETRSSITLSPRTLETVREGLRRVVADPKGTAHATVYIESLPIAGKTGTAETGGDQASHAWFAGYAPADEPRVAFVVVLEHAGEAATAAGPVAKRLVLRMEQLGLL
jgi:penicillin-binding protein 2